MTILSGGKKNHCSYHNVILHIYIGRCPHGKKIISHWRSHQPRATFVLIVPVLPGQKEKKKKGNTWVKKS